MEAGGHERRVGYEDHVGVEELIDMYEAGRLVFPGGLASEPDFRVREVVETGVVDGRSGDTTPLGTMEMEIGALDVFFAAEALVALAHLSDLYGGDNDAYHNDAAADAVDRLVMSTGNALAAAVGTDFERRHRLVGGEDGGKTMHDVLVQCMLRRGDDDLRQAVIDDETARFHGELEGDQVQDGHAQGGADVHEIPSGAASEIVEALMRALRCAPGHEPSPDGESQAMYDVACGLVTEALSSALAADSSMRAIRDAVDDKD